MREMRKSTRGAAKLASLTYARIAEWSGYSLHTVRKYASQGVFNARDLAACLIWINEQRAKRGWPLIGLPGENIPDKSTLDTMNCETPGASPYIPTVSNYNSLTGEFD